MKRRQQKQATYKSNKACILTGLMEKLMKRLQPHALKIQHLKTSAP